MAHMGKDGLRCSSTLASHCKSLGLLRVKRVTSTSSYGGLPDFGSYNLCSRTVSPMNCLASLQASGRDSTEIVPSFARRLNP